MENRKQKSNGWNIQIRAMLGALLGLYACRAASKAPESADMANIALSVLFFLFFWAAGYYARKARGKWETKKGWAFAGALFLGVSLQWGRQLDTVGNVNVTAPVTWLAVLGFGIFAAPLLAWGFAALDKAVSRENPAPAAEGFRQLAVRALLLAGAWLPVFAAVYPGFFAYDATDELQQVQTGAYVTRHPLLHVLLLGKTVDSIERLTGSYNAGIAVYVLAQMAGMAFLLSWVLGALLRLGAGRRLHRAGLFYFAFFPVIPMYVLCTSKDMPFTAGMLVVLVLLLRLVRQRDSFFADWKNPALLGVALFVMAMFRNNGFLVFLLLLPLLLVLAGKPYLGRMAATYFLVLLACIGVNTGLRTALKPQDTGMQETFTVPIQQLARTWVFSPELFTKKEREALFEILPQEVLERYDPKLSDLVKIDFQTQQYEKNPGRYQALWLKTGLKAPVTYLNAWLMTSYGFWYPDTVIDVYNGTRLYEDSSFFSFETEPPGTRDSRFPLLEKIYWHLSVRAWPHKIPVVSLPLSMGFFCWLYVLAELYLFSCGRKKEAAVLAPVALNLLTVLLGPTFLVRYVLIFWFALPVLPVTVQGALSMTGKV